VYGDYGETWTGKYGERRVGLRGEMRDLELLGENLFAQVESLVGYHLGCLKTGWS
jgi:hypothetical protein